MAEIGEVIGFEENKVIVKLQRTEACAKCRACSAGMQKNEMLIRCENRCGAAKGDKVEVALEEADFIKAVMIMYGFPFLMFVLGVFGGYYGCLHYNITNAEYIGFGLGMVMVVVAYLIVHSQEHRWRKGNYVPKAIAIRNE